MGNRKHLAAEKDPVLCQTERRSFITPQDASCSGYDPWYGG